MNTQKYCGGLGIWKIRRVIIATLGGSFQVFRRVIVDVWSNVNAWWYKIVILIHYVQEWRQNVKHIKKPRMFCMWAAWSLWNFVSSNIFLFCFYTDKLRLIHKPQTWKLSCIANAALLNLNLILLPRLNWSKTRE